MKRMRNFRSTLRFGDDEAIKRCLPWRQNEAGDSTEKPAEHGFRRLHIQLIFLLESLLVGVAGTAIGLTLGLILCRNLFAVDFFERFRSGLTLVVPWSELAAICVAAVCASLLASVLPAWQAGRVTPADAIRFE